MSLSVNSPPQPPKSPKLFRSQKELPKAEAEKSKIKGDVPSWVKGSFMRVGPGKFDFDKEFAVEHFLDGYAIVSKFAIENDVVTFEKKFLQSDAYKKAMIAQKPVVAEFAPKSSPDPTKSFFSKMIPSVIPELSDNGNLALFTLGNSSNLFATSETCYFRDIDVDTLLSADKFDTNKYFGVNNASAHPLTDEDGFTWNIGGSILTGIKFNVIKIPPLAKNQAPKEAFKKAKVVCSVNSSHTAHMSFTHSFGMTKKYLVLIEQPFCLSVSKILGAVLQKGQTPSNWLEWHPEFQNKFIIIEKETGKILKTEVVSQDPFFFLHIINCFEVNDHIVIDMTTFPNANSVNKLNLNKLRRMSIDDSDNSRGERYVIPLVDLDDIPEGVNQVSLVSDAKAIKVGKQLVITPETITEKGLELPVINKRFLAKKTSFYWATGSAQKGFFENALGKVHASKKETILWRESEHYFIGEPMFVPNPNSKSEDDGVLLAAVVDNRDDHNDFLLFLDAKTMKELGRAEFKSEIPQAVHGIWMPAEENPKKK
jgi:carotenoid cleavage dioxygenase-like enzyme